MALEEAGDDYTKDGTVDLRGNPVRRSQRGRWKACSFVVVYEAFERMAYYGISSNLVIYMTTKLHQGTVKSSNNVNQLGWDYLSHSHFGCLRRRRSSRSLPYFRNLVRYLFFGDVGVNFINNVGWGWGYGLPTFGLAISISVFLLGTPFYRHKLHMGSPFLKMAARVIVASFRKARAKMPHDHTRELPSLEYERKGTFPIQSTKSLRFLDKASLKTGITGQWNLCTTTEVEETKQMLNMLPVMCVTFVPSAMIAQINTLFVKQGTTLNARIIGNFSIPPASISAFVTVSLLVSIVLYDRVFVKIARKFTGNPRGITLLQRMGTGLIFHMLVMTVASFTERYRLKVAADHGLIHQTGVKLPLTIFVLLPQFVLMGMADAFLVVAKLEFFYDQAPESMKSLGTSYSLTSLGIGNFLSSFLLSTVSKITIKRGRGWILNNLNESRLDYYYLFFALINFVNFVLFLVVVKFYVYRAEVTHSVDVKEEESKVMGIEEDE
ncbi:BnaA02g24280D [Brassica napus]|uniref:BnaA02g24280D protein n=2 Tax=Brassica TaxID=3705 RepID=A0A078IFK2_BRANA|nr:BnaA02g24280D [Brassica napus]VDC90773.1 unnamed protein product [Brassica rapa]